MKTREGAAAEITQAAAEALLAFQVEGMGEHVGLDTLALEAQELARLLRSEAMILRTAEANEQEWNVRHRQLLAQLDDEVVKADEDDNKASDISWAQWVDMAFGKGMRVMHKYTKLRPAWLPHLVCTEQGNKSSHPRDTIKQEAETLQRYWKPLKERDKLFASGNNFSTLRFPRRRQYKQLQGQ